MKQKKRIGVGGSAANPPHSGHQALIHALLSCGLFDEVIWLPSGERDDKRFDVNPDQRIAMTELTFAKALRFKQGPTLTIKYDNVYGQNMITLERMKLLQRENPDAEITWYTGVDSVVPKEEFDGQCDIEAWWEGGAELIKNWSFLILPRVGYLMPENLPANFRILNVELPNIASSRIRELIRTGKPFEHLVPAEVAEYIKRFGLYQGERNQS